MVPNPVAVQYAYSWTSSIVIYTAIIHDAEWCGHNCTIYHAIMVISIDESMKWMSRSRISNVGPCFDSSERHSDPKTFLLLNGSQICHFPHWKNLLPQGSANGTGQKGENFQKFFFFGIFQKVSKVSKNIFWASYDHVVAQKSIFWTKISKKVVKTLPPPFPWLVSAVILETRMSKTELSSKFSKIFFQKIDFWATTWS